MIRYTHAGIDMKHWEPSWWLGDGFDESCGGNVTYHTEGPAIEAYDLSILPSEHCDLKTPDHKGDDELGDMKAQFDGRHIGWLPLPGLHVDVCVDF
jgi:hypothetical protein